MQKITKNILFDEGSQGQKHCLFLFRVLDPFANRLLGRECP